MKKYLFILLALFSVLACKDDEPDQDEIDEQKILDYLSSNDLDATKHYTGVYYMIEDTGSGYYPTINYTVLVKYKGSLLNGTVFDEASSATEIPLSQTIAGFQISCQLLKPGGSGMFFIPSGLAYGDVSHGDIPATSVLIFEIDMIDFY